MIDGPLQRFPNRVPLLDGFDEAKGKLPTWGGEVYLFERHLFPKALRRIFMKNMVPRAQGTFTLASQLHERFLEQVTLASYIRGCLSKL